MVMPQISSKLYKTKSAFVHYCEGCKELHIIPVEAPYNIRWNFNSNFDQPTFYPSIKHLIEQYKIADIICHYFITDGKIIYCSDCTHELQGQTKDLPNIPPETIEGWTE
jgi:hypothetical protein